MSLKVGDISSKNSEKNNELDISTLDNYLLNSQENDQESSVMNEPRTPQKKEKPVKSPRELYADSKHISSLSERQYSKLDSIQKVRSSDYRKLSDYKTSQIKQHSDPGSDVEIFTIDEGKFG